MAANSDATGVPHLTTALNSPLGGLESLLLEHQIRIETWFREQWRKWPAPITSSVDLRNAGFKLAPVDTNLFPAGFNNLNRDFLPLCIQAFQASLEKDKPTCKRVMIIPESHTRNKFYFESLATLHEIISKAGYDVRIGSLSPEITHPHVITTADYQFTLEPITRKDNRLSIGDFSPCVIILNNDLSDGIPDLLLNLEQTVKPSPFLGWSKRLKSQHFSHYQDVAREFSELIGIDPWLITPEFRVCDNVDFIKYQGLEELQHATAEILEMTAKRYREHRIQHPPFVVIKADAGTYGMGVIMVHSAEELAHLNRKKRTHMSVGKGHQPIRRVIIQEGVHSFETWGKEEAVAEPVVYMIGQYVVGGFYRVNQQRGEMENLNAPGMTFEPLAFASACNNPDRRQAPNACPNRFYAYGVIARLANLAAAREAAA